MGIKKYKIYPSSSYDGLDKTKIEPGIRWNLAGTEFIVEFIEEPHGNTVTMDRLTARQMMTTPEWVANTDT